MRKILVIAVLAVLAVVFVQPIRTYRDAQGDLAQARTQLTEAKAQRARAVAERRALGTRAVLVREARKRGYIFPGETPFAVDGR